MKLVIKYGSGSIIYDSVFDKSLNVHSNMSQSDNDLQIRWKNMMINTILRDRRSIYDFLSCLLFIVFTLGFI